MPYLSASSPSQTGRGGLCTMTSQTDDRSELMRAGVRARVAGLAGTVKVDARHWSPPVLLAVLCAGAFAQLLTAGVGGAALIATSIGAITSVGGGALSEVLLEAVGRLKPEGSKPASAEKLQADLERRIQQALEVGGENAARLRGEIAQALDEIGAVGAALEAAVQTGDRQVQEQLAVGLSEVGQQFDEFSFVLTDLRDELRLIQDGVNEQSGRSRLATDLLYQQGTDIRSLLELVSELAMHSRSGRVAGAGPGDEGEPRWADECPYRGLVPFSEADAHVFYGRQRDTARLVSTLAAHLKGPGLVVVTGASGAGKSSLLRAGLLPAIGRGGLSSAARDWPRRLIEEPTRSPLSRLATLLAAMAGLDAPSVLSSLASAPEQAHLLVRQAVEADAGRRGLDATTAADCRLVLVIDQFEEVFRVATGQDGATAARERAAFITALHAAATTPCGPGEATAALVVIAVRGDFTDRCANFPVLAAALQDSQFVVSPMTGADLRLAITGPAAAAGLDVEAGLVETILSELRSATGSYDAGALPLVSQIMLAVWEHREGRRLTLRGYARTDGVTDAVASSADAAYASLAVPARGLVRQVFHQLVDVSPTGHLARRTAPRAELYDPGGTEQGRADDFDRRAVDGGNRADDIDQILDAFTRRRLIVIDAGTVQIGHDILLEAWPRLRGWLEPDLTGYALYSQLRDAAAEWARHDHAASYLYQGERLAAVTQVRSRWEASPDRYPPLAGTPAEFLSASSTAQARRARRRQGVVTALASLLVIAVVTSVIALHARQSAVQARNVAIAETFESQSEALGDTNPVLSKMLSVAAYRIHPSDQATYAMLAAGALPGVNVMEAGSNWAYTVAFSPHGKTLASGNYDGTIRLWNAATGQQIGQTLNDGHAGEVNSIAFSHDGKTLASGDSNGTIQLWNVATGQQIRPPLNGRAGGVNSVAFSPDGTTLADRPVSDRPYRLGRVGRIQPQRQDPGRRQRRRDGTAACGAHRQADRQPGRPGGRSRPLDRVQLGRHDPGQRLRQRHDPAVGRGHRPANRETAQRQHRARQLRRVQPGRQDPGQRLRRRHDPAVGRGHRPANQENAHRQHRPGPLRRVQSRRQDPGQRRRRRQHGPAMGRGHRPANLCPDRSHLRGPICGVQLARHAGQRQHRLFYPAVEPGQRPPAHPKPAHRRHRSCQLGRVQPRRPDPGQRRRRRHGPAVGRGHRPADWRLFRRPDRVSQLGRVQPRRQDPGQR